MFAPLATSDSGTPRASTRRLRLRPFFSPIRGVRPYAFLRQRSLAHGAVNALPFPADTLHLVVFSQSGLPQTEEKAHPLPALKMRVHCAGTAEFARQRLPLATGAQHLNNGLKHLPGWHRLTSRAWPTTINTPSRSSDNGDKWFYLAPKRIRNSPRFDLRHPGTYLRPVCALPCMADSLREPS